MKIIEFLKAIIGKDERTRVVRQASEELGYRSARVVESVDSKASYAHLLVEQIRKDTKR